jgi:hypothetical protein
MREDDAFWAARIVATFSDEAIRAVVEKAQFTNPEATRYLTETLITRRDKVVRRWLTGINPLVDFALAADGRLTFANAAVDAGVASHATEYRLAWSRFDNATGEATAGRDAVVAHGRPVHAPAGLASGPAAPAFVQVDIASVHTDHPSWSIPVRVHFRRSGGGWELVGVERLVRD